MAGNYVPSDEFERYKRFHKEQFEKIGLEMVSLTEKVNRLSPGTPLPAQVRDLLDILSYRKDPV